MKEFIIYVLRFLKLDVLLLGLFEKIRLGLTKKQQKAKQAIETVKDSLDDVKTSLDETHERVQESLDKAQDALESFLD